jgi:Na+-transporting NADH:ubiquinone oxidoreductase subunit NqrC
MTEENKTKVYVYFFIALLLIAGIIFIMVTLKKDINEQVDKNENIIKYHYVATLNENMINYNLEIIDGEELNGELYSMDGEYLSDLKEGKAIINEIDYNKYDSFKIKVNDKIYEIEKK